MKNKIILITALMFFACGKKEDMILPEAKIGDTTNKAADSIVLKQIRSFNEYSLDSIVEVIYGKNLVQKAIIDKDSIKLYKPLVDLFGTQGLKSIYYKFSPDDKLMFGKGWVPGRINKLIFENNAAAAKSYSKFMDDFLHHKYENEGFFEFKAGMICFIDANTIYLIPVIDSCGDRKNINAIWNIIKDSVVAPSSKGIKMYCALDEYEIIE
ncbi:hypothetical protein [Flavobacterium beibuense]|uniref:Lipoprotein n=1 Tax=Flavobacterium beibuense TaxID=657326 RepID=A0A444W9Z3_9FLAO|nr:hypothetical protein [Flavobacterium beibuense]RYJ42438.1 hypothetical protein NU09_2224 [Flavobacterium beibuense]